MDFRRATCDAKHLAASTLELEMTLLFAEFTLHCLIYFA